MAITSKFMIVDPSKMPLEKRLELVGQYIRILNEFITKPEEMTMNKDNEAWYIGIAYEPAELPTDVHEVTY